MAVTGHGVQTTAFISQVRVGLSGSQDNQEQSGMAGAPRMETSGYEQSCLGLLIQLPSLETVILSHIPPKAFSIAKELLKQGGHGY